MFSQDMRKKMQVGDEMTFPILTDENDGDQVTKGAEAHVGVADENRR